MRLLDQINPQDKPWPEFLRLLPKYLEAKRTVKRERFGSMVLCTLSIDAFNFDVWVEWAVEPWHAGIEDIRQWTASRREVTR